MRDRARGPGARCAKLNYVQIVVFDANEEQQPSNARTICSLSYKKNGWAHLGKSEFSMELLSSLTRDAMRAFRSIARVATRSFGAVVSA
eukprot:9047897-Pyramimonas_sp.AAC.1